MLSSSHFSFDFFFFTRHISKNWNIRHLDLLKSTALGEGSSFFLRALHFHLCIAELSLKCTWGAEPAPFCCEGQVVRPCLNNPPRRCHFPFSLFLLRIGLLISLLGGLLCSTVLLKGLSEHHGNKPLWWRHRFYRGICWGVHWSVRLLEAKEVSVASRLWLKVGVLTPSSFWRCAVRALCLL